MMPSPATFPPARNPIEPAPIRRPGSVRRTSTIDTTWPEGYGRPMLMQGFARDVSTPDGGELPIDVGFQDSRTHLNDVLRSMAEVPAMATNLPD
jgi:hypothetical protein